MKLTMRGSFKSLMLTYFKKNDSAPATYRYAADKKIHSIRKVFDDNI